MPRDKKIEVELVFDAKGSLTSVKTAEGEFLALNKAADRNVKTIGKLSTAMKVGIAAAALAMGVAVRKGFQLVDESVQLAGVQQIAERKLEQALLNTGDASEESAAMLKKLATEVQNLSNFGDEAIITAQAMLLSFSEVSGADGAALLTSRLADVAAGVADATGQTIGLNSAAAALGKALGGGAGALREYGISLSAAQEEAFNTLEGMEKVRLLTEILDSNFKGLAAATANPFTQAQNAVNDLKETLGTELLPEIENTARQFTQFIQDERVVDFAKRVGSSLVNIGQGVIRFFQFSIPIAMNRLKGAVAEGSASVLESLGNLDPRRIFGGDNPFLGTIESLRESAAASGEFVEQLKNQEIQQSANRIQAMMLAEANRELASSMLQVNEAQTGGRRSPVASVAEVDPRAIAQQNLTLITRDQISARMELQMEELNEAERLNDLKLLLIEKEQQAQREAMVANQMAAASNVKTAQDAANALRGIVLQVIQMKIAEAIANAIPKTSWPLNVLLAPLAALATNALFNNLIPEFASGVTGFSGGLALVGERGPEFVSLGQGSNVVTNENTNRILERIDAAQSGSPTVNVNNNGFEGALSRLGDRIEQMEIKIDYFGLTDGITRHEKQQRIISG